MPCQQIADRQNKLIEYSDFAPTIDNRKGLVSLPASDLSDDAQLVTRLRTGDHAAFEELVRKFGGRLLATARRYLRSDDDACDTLQDAFLCAFKAIGTFRGQSQLSTWLHRITLNSALMRLRVRRRQPLADGVGIDELLPQFDPAGNWSSESRSTMPAHASLEISETKAMVRRCIERLPETYRIVLILRDLDELDTGEVATLLGVTPNNVKVRLHRARQALKVLIERE
jgi:RNA polymerase sigma-70 factor (ECF subfamily)